MSAVLLIASTASSGVLHQQTEPAPERNRAVDERGGDGNGDTPLAPASPNAAAGVTTEPVSDQSGDPGPATLTAGVPATVLDAYYLAYQRTNLVQPHCRIPLALLAAIGKVESGHARGGRVDADGTTLRPILGPVLNGGAFAAIRDTDGGALDGDSTWDRAVGPMQFIPSTWARWAADGNGDGRADPHNIYDASLASARYLCADSRDLGTPDGLNAAVLSYNHSTSYLNLVRSWMATYRDGSIATPDGAGAIPVGYNPDSVGPVPAPDREQSQPPPTSAPTTPGAVTTPPSPAPPGPAPGPAPGPVPGQEPQCDEQGLVETLTGLVGSLLGSERDGCVPQSR